MQGRMKQHQLTQEQIRALLERASVGRLTTLGEDGAPYTTPVHFLLRDGKIYIHGLCAGEKISNLKRDGRACFEVDEMAGLLLDEQPCECNTAYESVIIKGRASLLEGAAHKEEILRGIVEKYVPQCSGRAFPERMVRATGIIELTPVETTGKYYR